MNIPVGGDIGEEVHLVDQALTFTQGEQPNSIFRYVWDGVDSGGRCDKAQATNCRGTATMHEEILGTAR